VNQESLLTKINRRVYRVRPLSHVLTLELIIDHCFLSLLAKFNYYICIGSFDPSTVVLVGVQGAVDGLVGKLEDPGGEKMSGCTHRRVRGDNNFRLGFASLLLCSRKQRVRRDNYNKR